MVTRAVQTGVSHDRCSRQSFTKFIRLWHVASLQDLTVRGFGHVPPLLVLFVSVIYSGLMPAIRITFAHFGISVSIRLENSSGVLSIVSKPSDASF
jgi:hypothetical protein